MINIPATNIPYGYWPSPITAELLTAQGVRISEPQTVRDCIYWLESRPQEKGRTALVRESAGVREDIISAPHSIRTRAHEYGGAPYLATASAVFYVLDSDQRIYRYDLASKDTQVMTPEGAYRYADFCYDDMRGHLLAVREDCTEDAHQPESQIIALNLLTGEIHILAQGADFYSNPRLSPDGKQLSFLRWNHSNMPWDGTECVLAQLNQQGDMVSSAVIAGGADESVFQPQWSPTGELFFVSDRSNWWNIYRWIDAEAKAVCVLNAEFATPQWVFGMSCYGFLSSNDILCCFSQQGFWQLGVINSETNLLTKIESNFRDIANIYCSTGVGYFVAASATKSAQLWQYASGKLTALSDNAQAVPEDFISPAHPITFPTRDGESAHGFFYAPKNPDVKQPTEQLPPLLVMCHGGPTGATESSLNLKIQFWTSRGFAVLDVNYRGSTGYGKQYRARLKNNWGITDVIDVCSGVDYLAAQQLIDKNKVAIRGSSAGGYTVLAALTFSDVFKAGASLYGIGDLEALARDTHKFEAHYLDSLVGEYPAQKAIYQERSPIHHIEQLNCPVIFLQGLQDKVVPPAQAEAMVAALQKKGIMTKYVTFEEEGHGFRQAHNIQRALNEELAFYLTVFSKN
ncbi:MAG: prolyl oligopeptidase family serine peptidase [Cellvibrio sp.]|uniref:S9 family peptidase n=1 Tax=Cellvibrio sp. TaxID=1965322 RepID=UPI0027200F24|nr:prolyl oligopeptidase family serine peptidase [Cellvibrio sp.]